MDKTLFNSERIERAISAALVKYCVSLLEHSLMRSMDGVASGDVREVILETCSEGMLGLACAIADAAAKGRGEIDEGSAMIGLHLPQDCYVVGLNSPSRVVYLGRLRERVSELLDVMGLRGEVSELQWIVSVLANLATSEVFPGEGFDGFEDAVRMVVEKCCSLGVMVARDAQEGARGVVAKLAALVSEIAMEEAWAIEAHGNWDYRGELEDCRVRAGMLSGIFNLFIEAAKDMGRHVTQEDLSSDHEESGVDEARVDEMLKDVDLGEDVVVPWRSDARPYLEDACWRSITLLMGIPRDAAGIARLPGGQLRYRRMLVAYKRFIRDVARFSGLDWDAPVPFRDAVEAMNRAALCSPMDDHPQGVNLRELAGLFLSFEKELVEFTGDAREG